MRYAGYVRISSEEQVGNFSVDAQRRAIEAWVAAKGGQLVKVYVDEAQSGRTADRPEFNRMRHDARSRKFDALVLHKFDRFSRNRTDALAIKSLLRRDYGVKVFSVMEPSEDSDGPIGALIEGIMGGYAAENASVCTQTLFGATPVDPYPYDPVNQQGQPVSQEEFDRLGSWAWEGASREQINQWRASDKNPGATLDDDASCFLAFWHVDQIARQALCLRAG